METLKDTALEAVRAFLASRGWSSIEDLTDDFGQMKDPATGRTHDLDYAFTLELQRQQNRVVPEHPDKEWLDMLADMERKWRKADREFNKDHAPLPIQPGDHPWPYDLIGQVKADARRAIQDTHHVAMMTGGCENEVQLESTAEGAIAFAAKFTPAYLAVRKKLTP